MAEGLNKVMLLGNLGADPELRVTPSGQSILKLRLATTESYLDKGGTRQERTEWHRITVWGKRGRSSLEDPRQRARPSSWRGASRPPRTRRTGRSGTARTSSRPTSSSPVGVAEAGPSRATRGAVEASAPKAAGLERGAAGVGRLLRPRKTSPGTLFRAVRPSRPTTTSRSEPIPCVSLRLRNGRRSIKYRSLLLSFGGGGVLP
jgi:hypothetical protein